MASRKIGRFEITDDCVLRFGSRDDGPAMSCSLYRLGRSDWPSVDRRPSAVMRAPARALRIGRADDNDIVLADLSVSRHHAELRNAGDGRYEIADLDSTTGRSSTARGSFSPPPVTEQDIIGIGPATFRLVGGELREFIDKRRRLPGRAGPDGARVGRQSPARPGELPDRRAQPGRGHRAQRGGEDDAAPRPDRDARPRPRARSCTTTATSTRITPNCGTGSAWCPRRTSSIPTDPAARPRLRGRTAIPR